MTTEAATTPALQALREVLDRREGIYGELGDEVVAHAVARAAGRHAG